MRQTQLTKNELNKLLALNARIRYHGKQNNGYGVYSRQYRNAWIERNKFMKNLSNKYYGGKSIVANHFKLASVGQNTRLRSAAKTVSFKRRAQLNKRKGRQLAMRYLIKSGIPEPVARYINEHVAH